MFAHKYLCITLLMITSIIYKRILLTLLFSGWTFIILKNMEFTLDITNCYYSYIITPEKVTRYIT